MSKINQAIAFHTLAKEGHDLSKYVTQEERDQLSPMNPLVSWLADSSLDRPSVLVLTMMTPNRSHVPFALGLMMGMALARLIADSPLTSENPSHLAEEIITCLSSKKARSSNPALEVLNLKEEDLDAERVNQALTAVRDVFGEAYLDEILLKAAMEEKK